MPAIMMKQTISSPRTSGGGGGHRRLASLGSPTPSSISSASASPVIGRPSHRKTGSNPGYMLAPYSMNQWSSVYSSEETSSSSSSSSSSGSQQGGEMFLHPLLLIPPQQQLQQQQQQEQQQQEQEKSAEAAGWGHFVELNP